MRTQKHFVQCAQILSDKYRPKSQLLRRRDEEEHGPRSLESTNWLFEKSA
jgi:hypothetical protein